MKQLNLLLLLLIPLLHQAQDITVTYTGSRNNPGFKQASIPSGTPSMADTSQALLYITGNTNSLLRFDLGELPTNTIITGAYLYVYGVTDAEKSWKAAPINSVFDGSAAHYPQMAWIAKVLSPWSMPTVCYNNQPEPADEYDESTKYLPVPPGTWANYKVNLTDFVTGWVRTPSSNYGMEFIFNYLNSKEAGSMNLYSGQAIPELQPKLVITYRAPTPAPICTATMTLRGNLADGKYKQINYRFEPGVNDSTESLIDCSSLDAGIMGFPEYSDYMSRAIMRYDVSAIPAGTTITSARLYLYAKDGNSHYPGVATTGEAGAYLEQVVLPWTYSTLDPINNPAITTATHRKTLELTDNTMQNYNVDVTEFVQNWVNKPDSNYGMQLRLQSEAPVGLMLFHSAQAPDSLQPRLEICYTPLPAPADSCTVQFTDSILTYDKKTHLFLPVTSNNNAKPPARICWTFGDGTDSCVYYDSGHPYTGAPMRHGYANEYFSYPVCIRVLYQDSCTASYCAESTPASFCTASFRDSVYISNGLQHRFTPVVTNTQNKRPVYICWSFGDGNSTCLHYDSAHPYTAEPLPYTYAIPDDYQVSVTVQYDDSCSASYSDYIRHSFCDHNGVISRFNATDGRFRQAVISSKTPTVADTSQVEMICEAWSNGNDYFYYRTALLYDLSYLPSNAVIMGATLNLYANTASTNGYAGAPVYIDYPGVLQHIAAPWSPSTISWNNQPAVDTMGQVLLPVPNDASFKNNYVLDVTRLVKYWKENPGSNFGALLRLTNERPRSSMIFRSGLAIDSLKPQLSICYYIPDTSCSASFTDSLLITARATHCLQPMVVNSAIKKPVRICWAFGDGTDSCAWYTATQPYTGAPAYHTYPDMHRSYSTTMNVLYDDGCSASYQLNTRAASSCQATISDDQQSAGPNHVFHAAYSDNIYQRPLNVCWSFGDGSDTCIAYDAAHPEATAVMPHSFAANGLYTVCVTAHYEDGCAANACYNANYVNCDSAKLVIYGNNASGKYRQAKVGSRGTPTDTTQNDFLTLYGVTPETVENPIIIRTMFRYELSGIPDSAIVLNARLYLHKKDTAYPGWSASPYNYRGTIDQMNGVWWPMPEFYGSYGNFGPLSVPMPVGSTQADLTGMVQQWVSHPETNYGAVFHVAPESPMALGLFYMAFYSGQAPDSLQPRLEICYAVPHHPNSQARAIGSAAQASPLAAPVQAWLYPNPATNMLNVLVQSNQVQTGTIYLYDMQGRMVEVLQQHAQYNKGNNLIHVPVNRSHVSPGIYLVKIQAGTGSYTYKVILK